VSSGTLLTSTVDAGSQSTARLSRAIEQCESGLAEFAPGKDDAVNVKSEVFEKLASIVAEIKTSLDLCGFSSGLLFCDEIAATLECRVQKDIEVPDTVIKSAIGQLLDYLKKVKTAGKDVPGMLLWPANELRAVREKTLINSSVFSLPAGLKATESDELIFQQIAAVPVDNAPEARTLQNLPFEPIPGQNQLSRLREIGTALHRQASTAQAQYSQLFWTTGSAFIEAVEANQTDVLSGAVKQILGRIEKLLSMEISENSRHPLSADDEDQLDRLFCDMLVYIGISGLEGDTFTALESRFQPYKSVNELNRIADSSQSAQGEMLVSGIKSGFRLLAATKLLVDAVYEDHDQGRRGVKSERALKNMNLLIEVASFLSCPQAARYFKLGIASFTEYVEKPETVHPLVRCAASLVSAERAMRVVHKDYFDGSEIGTESLDNVDDLLLDEILIRELSVDVRLIRENYIDGGVTSEQMLAVLEEVTALSTYLADSYLEQELGRVLVSFQAHNADHAQHRDSLFALISAVYEYLSHYTVFKDRLSAQKALSSVALLLQDKVASTAQPGDNKNQTVIGAVVVKRGEPVDSRENMTQQVESEAVKEVAEYSASISFGNKCNTYVDVIQQSLDTALGSSGNLAPDRSVVNALDNLHKIVAGAGLLPLLNLIEPLALVIGNAESSGRTLSQADTLLVQESIVAITIGIDSLVNHKEMPAMIVEVSERMAASAAEGNHGLRGDGESAGLVDVFVEEAEELLQRLFELIQRWRGAPRGGSKLQGDINRLLHTLKGSADTVGLTSVASFVHDLETAFLASKNSEIAPTAEFFDLVLEAVEFLGDDIDRIRNGEQQQDHSEITDKLVNTAAMFGVESVANSLEYDTSESGVPGPDAVASDTDHHRSDRMISPVFGSAKYFFALESSRKMLNRNHSEGCSMLDEFKQQNDHLKLALQSIRHLLEQPAVSGVPGRENLPPVTNKSIDESVSDLVSVQRNFDGLLTRYGANISKQTSALGNFNALVGTADLVSVASLRVRLESIVRRAATAVGKPVELELQGDELQLDRKLYSDLLSPLEQLIVNSVVHGIEPREKRMALGKKQHGSIVVRFSQQTDCLEISVQDDGAGVDVDQLRVVVGERNGINVSSRSDAEMLSLLTEQEVSTAQSADLTAGRGVGLDIVREVLYRHCGTMDIVTTRNKGTAFTLQVPLRTFSDEVLLVESAGQYFAIQHSRILSVQSNEEDAVSLNQLLGQKNPDQAHHATVVECKVTGGNQYIRVDSVVGRRVVRFSKGSESLLMAIPFYAGSAVIEGQRLVLLLDIDYLFKSKKIVKPIRAGQNSQSQTVLIVDDSVTVRASFGRALTGRSFEIVLARNGLEALEFMKKSTPDAIVLDLEMPGMNGFELADKLKADSKLDAVPLVIVTSRSESEIGDWLEKTGADLYFEKPCSEEKLGRAVVELLEPAIAG